MNQTELREKVRILVHAWSFADNSDDIAEEELLILENDVLDLITQEKVAVLEEVKKNVFMGSNLVSTRTMKTQINAMIANLKEKRDE